MRFSIKDWFLFVALLALAATSYQYYQTCKWVRSTAENMRTSAWEFGSVECNPGRVEDVIKVYAHWLEWAVGDRSDFDGSVERTTRGQRPKEW